MTEDEIKKFGVCPHCHETDGYVERGGLQWFFCEEHLVKWWQCDSTLPPTEGTEEQAEFWWFAMNFAAYEIVQPIYQ
jgi:hypothetical protein